MNDLSWPSAAYLIVLAILAFLGRQQWNLGQQINKTIDIGNKNHDLANSRFTEMRDEVAALRAELVDARAETNVAKGVAEQAKSQVGSSVKTLNQD